LIGIDTPQNRASMPIADFNKWTKAEEIAIVMEFIISSRGDKMKDVIIRMQVIIRWISPFVRAIKY
jgi:hypothetical protein